jgi:hypothetical protein
VELNFAAGSGSVCGGAVVENDACNGDRVGERGGVAVSGMGFGEVAGS